MIRRLGLVFGLTAWVGCGGSSAPPPGSAVASPSASAPVATPRVVSRSDRLSRRDVVSLLSRGLGDFLTRVELQPSLTDGKFHGWGIVRFRDGDPLWSGIELAPGDVVTAVNGRPIERPEQALTAFQSLAVARELRVTYERDGARKEIVYPIDDEATR